MKNIVISIVAAVCLALSGCASYNSIVPDWAKVNPSSESVSDSKSSNEDETRWWNPLSWF